MRLESAHDIELLQPFEQAPRRKARQVLCHERSGDGIFIQEQKITSPAPLARSSASPPRVFRRARQLGSQPACIGRRFNQRQADRALKTFFTGPDALAPAHSCFQPITRGELSSFFGKEVSRDLIGVLRGQGLIASGPRSPQSGAPYTYVTTKNFLSQFGLDTLRQLPDFEALEDAGLLSKEKLLAGDIPNGLGRGEGDGEEGEPTTGVVEDEAL